MSRKRKYVFDPRLSSLEASFERALEVIDDLLGLLEFPEQFVSVKVDGPPATGAGHRTVRLEPSERFIRLNAALGAFNRDLLLVEKTTHSNLHAAGNGVVDGHVYAQQFPAVAPIDGGRDAE